MNLPMRPNHKTLCLLALCLSAATGGQAAAAPARPPEAELERTVGQRVAQPIGVLSWKASMPAQTNLTVYSVLPPLLNEPLLRRVAEKLSITGRVERITGETMGHVGYCIKETNAATPLKVRTVSLWTSIGTFVYSSGDDGYRYNKTTKLHEVFGVPDKAAAKATALGLLPVLGLSTNELEHYPNGRLRWSSSARSVGYTDKESKQRKSLAIAQTVNFYQRVPAGGTTAGVGDGGELSFTFVSDGKLAGIHWFFRKLEKAGEVDSKSSEEILRDLRNGNAFTWHQTAPDSLVVTNCVLTYPQGNSWLNQKYLWPFYQINGLGADEMPVTLFVPSKW